MRQYEITYLTAREEDLPKVGEFISTLGGSVAREFPLGKRRLAYPIKKHDWAFYAAMVFDFDAEKLRELNEKLRLSPFMIRYLVVSRPVKKVDLRKEEEVLKRLEDSHEDVPVPLPAEEKPKTLKTKARKPAEEKAVKAKKISSDKERQKVLDEQLKKILEEEF